MELINGRILAEKIKDGIANTVYALGTSRPNLAILLVGEREDSKLYVGLKEKQAKLVGVDTHVYNCDAEITEEELLGVIEYLNNDELIDAILLQLPLPEHISEDVAIAAIRQDKEVDGFHPENIKNYLANKKYLVEPVVPTVVSEMLDSIEFKAEGKTAVVVANSEIFGTVLQHELINYGCKTSVVHVDDKSLSEILKSADLIVTAVGRPKYLNETMIKAGVVIIDIGISKDKSGVVVGDVDQFSVKNKASYISPVPGGVGPMTIAVALRNVSLLHLAKHKI